MQTNKKNVIFQWTQLLVLSVVHMWIDLTSNMMPAILPEIRIYFGLSLLIGGAFLVIEFILCSGIQVLVGPMRKHKERPLFMYIGVLMTAGFCVIGLLPQSHCIWIIVLLAVITGVGIGIVHPEALRAIHKLNAIPPNISTAIFMAGGFIGYSAGGTVSASLVSTKFGLKGLLFLLGFPVFFAVLLMFLKVKLAVESPSCVNNTPDSPVKSHQNTISFWPIFFMSIPAAFSTTLLVSLLPTALADFGFKLTFGGLSSTVFGIGGTLGVFVLSAIAHKKGELKCIVFSFFTVIPFSILYLIFMHNQWAIWLLFIMGFFIISSYILMITMSRRATGPSIGARMGLIVGGSWAIANILFLPILFIADHFSAAVVLKLIPAGLLCSAVMAAGLLRKLK